MFNNKNPIDFGIIDLKDFKEDPKFIHIDDVLRVLAFCFMKHIHVAINIVSNQHFDVGNIDLNAGNVFNNYMLKNPFTQNTNISDEIKDDEIVNISTIFKNKIEKFDRLRIYSQQIEDPLDCMFEFCHYFFIPARVNVSTIPRDIRINSLRKWISVVMSLPLNRIYTSRYINAINNVQSLQQIYEKLIESETTVKNIENMTEEFVYRTINRVYTEKNTAHVFIRVYMNIFLVSTIEIMKKYCPNIHECIVANPNYDGSWINPFDPKYNEQVSELNKLNILVATKS